MAVGVATLAVIAGGALTAWAGLVDLPRSASGCSGTPSRIVVTTTPEDAPAIDKIAKQWTATGPSVNGRCVAASVSSKPPGAVASALGTGWDPNRDGAAPDVWIPDSSLWISVASSRPDAAAVLPRDPVSIASSPVVMALRQPLAQTLGWPQNQLKVTDAIGAFNQPDVWAKAGHPEWAALRVGVTDPSTSTAGLATVLTILDQDGTGKVGPEQLVAGLGLSRVIGALAPDTAAFLAAQDPAAPAGPNSIAAAFPALERDIAKYDAANPPMPLVPLYAPERPIVADYPYTILAGDWVSATDREAAEQFQRFLLTAEARAVLGEHGLRAPDHTVPTRNILPAEQGFQPSIAAPRANPGPAALSTIMAEWANLQRRVNLLAVVDTSGSMSLPVPGTNLTRLSLLQQTAGAGFGLLPNTMSIGLWEFSGRPDSRVGYRVLVPFGPVTANVGSVPRNQALVGAIPQLRAAGATPLYNTIYAAFHHMQQQWQPNSTNSILLITDGANELNGGLSLTELTARLAKEQLPDKPVQIVSIAVGPDADAAALQQVATATGGRTFVIKDPAAAIQTLILAFTGRLQ